MENGGMDIEYLEDVGKKNLLIKVSGDCDMYSAQEFFINVTKIWGSGPSNNLNLGQIYLFGD